MKCFSNVLHSYISNRIVLLITTWDSPSLSLWKYERNPQIQLGESRVDVKCFSNVLHSFTPNFIFLLITTWDSPSLSWKYERNPQIQLGEWRVNLKCFSNVLRSFSSNLIFLLIPTSSWDVPSLSKIININKPANTARWEKSWSEVLQQSFALLQLQFDWPVNIHIMMRCTFTLTNK